MWVRGVGAGSRVRAVAGLVCMPARLLLPRGERFQLGTLGYDSFGRFDDIPMRVRRLTAHSGAVTCENDDS